MDDRGEQFMENCSFSKERRIRFTFSGREEDRRIYLMSDINLKGRHFLKLLDYAPEEIAYLVDLAAEYKAKKEKR
jgi:hypothetical protein